MFDSCHPRISLGLFVWGKVSATAFLLLGMRNSGPSGGRGCRVLRSVTPLDFSSLCDGLA